MKTKVQTYTITLTTDAKGRKHLLRENRGFDAFQLLGIVSLIKEEIIQLLHTGEPKPDIIERKVEKRGK